MQHELHVFARQGWAETQRGGLNRAAQWRCKDDVDVLVRENRTERATLLLALGREDCIADGVIVLQENQ
jgi:hypothetical protein